MIDSSTIANAIQAQIAGTVERSVEQYVENIVRALAMDQAWISRMEQMISESVSRKFNQKLSGIDVNSLVMEAIGPALDLYFERHRAAAHGLIDEAKETQLTIRDGSVEIKDQAIADSLKISKDAEIGQTLTVRNLAVKGAINIDNETWQTLSTSIAQQTQERLTEEWRDQLIESVVEQIQAKGIDFADVKIDGRALIDGDTLAPALKRSSLTQVGNLESLRVSGSADLGNSLSVRPRRVGINTEHPDMALAVWDEEVALVFGKQKEQTAYVGTLRPQRLMIGVNKTAAIDINDQGQVTVSHLTVGRHRVCHEPECPNYSGTKGDIVFNSNPKNDGVWGWQCLGAFRWQPLRSA